MVPSCFLLGTNIYRLDPENNQVVRASSGSIDGCEPSMASSRESGGVANSWTWGTNVALRLSGLA